jgi:hypothetical protein
LQNNSDGCGIIGEEPELHEQCWPALSRRWLKDLFLYPTCSAFSSIETVKGQGKYSSGRHYFQQDRNSSGVKPAAVIKTLGDSTAVRTQRAKGLNQLQQLE